MGAPLAVVPITDETGEFISAPEAQRQFGCSPTALKTEALKRKIRTQEVPRSTIVLYSRSDVRKWVEGRKARKEVAPRAAKVGSK
jgi:hypothetical protein